MQTFAFQPPSITITPASGGNLWSNPATWGGSVPTATSDVTITSDVVWDSPRIDFRTLTIAAGGSLTLDASAGGSYEAVIGSGTLSPPDAIGIGIVCQGKLHLKGREKTPFVRLAVSPVAGATTLQLASAPSGWNVGDVLLLPDTRQANDPPAGFNWQYETATIAAISGSTVTLSAPLLYAHPGSAEEPTLKGHVANLTRNVVIRSAGPTRGHGHFSANADIDLRNIEGIDLGRTTKDPVDPVLNPVGRYALHVHMLTGPIRASGYRFVIQGCSLHDTTPNSPVIWPYTIHGTDDGLVSDNVAFNCSGAGFMGEEHSARNVIERNFACGVKGNGMSRAEEGRGREGAGFWGQDSTTNQYRNNVAANCALHGYTFFGGVGFTAFEDNECYGGRSGLTMWAINGAGSGNPNRTAPRTSITRFTVWHCWEHGVGLGYPAFNIDFVDLRVFGTGRASGRGWWFGDYETLGMRLIRPVIKSVRYAVWPSFYGPPGDQFLIEDPVFRNNEIDVVVETPGIPGGGGWTISPREVLVVNPDWTLYPAERWNLFMYHHPTPNTNFAADVARIHYGPGGSGEHIRVYYNEQTTQPYGGVLAPSGTVTRPGINGLVEVEL